MPTISVGGLAIADHSNHQEVQLGLDWKVLSHDLLTKASPQMCTHHQTLLPVPNNIQLVEDYRIHQEIHVGLNLQSTSIQRMDGSQSFPLLIADNMERT